VDQIDFEWDPREDAVNQAKHGVPFAYATRVFLDPYRIEIEDSRRDYGEQRLIVVGEIESAVFVVVHTLREAISRIISARRANQRETAFYRQVQAQAR
jgi:uncharacterized DUF497 family protein